MTRRRDAAIRAQTKASNPRPNKPATSRPSRRRAASPRSGPTDLETDEVLASIRDIYRDDPSPRKRGAVLAALRKRFGKRRSGHRIRKQLDNCILTATLRGVLVREVGEYVIACRQIGDYERKTLKKQFLAAVGRKWQTRDEAITAAARHLGFRRTGANIRKAFASIINGALRTGELKKDRKLIRRT